MVFVAHSERQLEEIRQKLCSETDFTPIAIFRKIDQRCRDKISSVELHQFFINHSSESNVGEHECRRVIRYYDSDGDGALNLSE